VIAQALRKSSRQLGDVRGDPPRLITRNPEIYPFTARAGVEQ